MKLCAVLAACALAAACAHHAEEGGPAGIAYACADGRAVRVVYENGGDPIRGRARLLLAGEEHLLAAAAAITGLRYMGVGSSPLVWSVGGDEAVLGEIGESGGEEREIARCTRVREPSAAEAAEAGAEGHGDDH